MSRTTRLNPLVTLLPLTPGSVYGPKPLPTQIGPRDLMYGGRHFGRRTPQLHPSYVLGSSGPTQRRVRGRSHGEERGNTTFLGRTDPRTRNLPRLGLKRCQFSCKGGVTEPMSRECTPSPRYEGGGTHKGTQTTIKRENCGRLFLPDVTWNHGTKETPFFLEGIVTPNVDGGGQPQTEHDTFPRKRPRPKLRTRYRPPDGEEEGWGRRRTGRHIILDDRCTHWTCNGIVQIPRTIPHL